MVSAGPKVRNGNKEYDRLFVFAHDMIVWVWNPKYSHTETLE